MRFLISLFSLMLIALLFSGCSRSEEQRREAIKLLLTEQIEKTPQIEIVNESYDSVYSTHRNISYLNEIQKIILLRDSLAESLADFKTRHANKENRVWLKTLEGETRYSYKEIGDNEERLCSLVVEMAEKCNSDTMIGRPQLSAFIKYNSANTTKYGLFIFKGNKKISEYKIFTEEEYEALNDFITQAQKNAIKYIPSFESVGIDVVPEDEDPSKTKEERAKIKAQQEAKRVEAHRAFMKRTNPITRTFYGATIGKTPVQNLIRRLKYEGWNVTQLCNYSFSEWYCSKWRDYLDGLSYNVIRVYAHDGIFDKIEFIDDFTPEWGARKRCYDAEIKDAFRRAKSSANDKFGFWREGYDNTDFNDGTTNLKVSTHGYCVSYTFSK